MVEKSEKNGKAGAHKPSVVAGHAGIKCIGAICFNPDTGKIEIELKRGDCDIQVIKDVVSNVVGGSEIEWIVPPPGGQGVKE